jgi:hypothetical protein
MGLFLLMEATTMVLPRSRSNFLEVDVKADSNLAGCNGRMGSLMGKLYL